jgi:hypothetical protein
VSNISGFIGCCGADVIYGFANDPKTPFGMNANIYNPLTKRYEPNPKAKSYEQAFRDGIANQKRTYKAGGRMFCLILNETQAHGYDDAWLKIIKSEGFECVRRWTNANHDDPEYLYLFVLCTDEKGRCNGDHTVPPTGWDSIPPGKQDSITTTEVLGSKAAS